jgi:hypothetical protein
VLEPLAGDAAGAKAAPETATQAMDEYPDHVRKPYRTGPELDPETDRLYKLCQDEYIVKDRPRRRVVATVRERCPGSLPEDDEKAGAMVTEYVKRFARRFDPPLPLAPAEARKFCKGG